MKRSIIALLALFALQSCVKKAPEYVILSGKFTDNQDEKFIVKSPTFEKSITINQDGTFVDTLHIHYNGIYQIGRKIIYLHQGKNLSFEADNLRFSQITFAGDLATENNYIKEKEDFLQESIKDLSLPIYALEESEFLLKIEELTQKQKERANAVKFSIADFKEKELRNIQYAKDYWLENYKSTHQYYVKEEDFKVSENYPKISTTDFDNADDFNFSQRYSSLVMKKFEDNISEIYQQKYGKTEDTDKYNEIMFVEFEKIKSQNIKNSIALWQFMNGSTTSKRVMEFFYKELLANSVDQGLKTKISEHYTKLMAIEKGKFSPKFNYENHKGGMTSLDDLKGKFIYIDVWATWCGPCVREIPYLKEVEKKYHGKNIEFVSISIDAKKDHEKWKQFVTEQQMGGVQLIADNDWKSQFVQDYLINGIPRFILLDPEGRIVKADAPRPSEPELIELFDQLGI